MQKTKTSISLHEKFNFLTMKSSTESLQGKWEQTSSKSRPHPQVNQDMQNNHVLLVLKYQQKCMQF